MKLSPAAGDRNYIARAQFNEEAIQAVIVYAWESVSKEEDLLYSSEKTGKKVRQNRDCLQTIGSESGNGG